MATVRRESLVGRLVTAIQPSRPLWRVSVSPWWARLLVAAGARRATSPDAMVEVYGDISSVAERPPRVAAPAVSDKPPPSESQEAEVSELGKTQADVERFPGVEPAVRPRADTWGGAGPMPAVGSRVSASTQTAPGQEKGRRIVGAERRTLAKDLVRRYEAGESIRALASSTGHSYGFVHRVLVEAGVQIRRRGGARRRKKA